MDKKIKQIKMIAKKAYESKERKLVRAINDALFGYPYVWVMEWEEGDFRFLSHGRIAWNPDEYDLFIQVEYKNEEDYMDLNRRLSEVPIRILKQMNPVLQKCIDTFLTDAHKGLDNG